jgi:hypothetical protein
MDDTLLEATLHTTGPARVDLLDVLITRQHAPTLAKLVDRYGSGSAVLDELLVDRVRSLESGLRLAVGAASPASRGSGLALIIDANDPAMSYILAEGLGHADEQTRNEAGDGLHTLTTRFLSFCALDPEGAAGPLYEQQTQQLASALGQAIQRWERHTHRTCLASALWMGLPLRDAIERKLKQARNELHRPIERMLDQTTDTRLAGFALTGLSIAPLRGVAARTIGTSQDLAFIDAVIRQAPLLADEGVRRGCRWIKTGSWLSFGLDRWIGGDEDRLTGVIEFLRASGVPTAEKLSLYRRLIDETTPAVRHLALNAANEDLRGSARSLLTALAIRAGDELGDQASSLLMGENAAGSARTEDDRDLVARYFDGALPLTAVNPADMRRALDCLPGGALPALRLRLASIHALDKARALHLARAVGLVADLEPQVHRLVHDSDPTVRSVAVAMLVLLPGPTSQRLARTCADDADDRVRAGAIESMDALEVRNRSDCTGAFLTSRHPRLRGNAVKSLLTMSDARGGETLLDMLSDASPAHRLSALWVVDRLCLRSVGPQVQGLATRDADERVRLRAQAVLGRLAKDTQASPSMSGGAL